MLLETEQLNHSRNYSNIQKCSQNYSECYSTIKLLSNAWKAIEIGNSYRLYGQIWLQRRPDCGPKETGTESAINQHICNLQELLYCALLDVKYAYNMIQMSTLKDEVERRVVRNRANQMEMTLQTKAQTARVDESSAISTCKMRIIEGALPSTPFYSSYMDTYAEEVERTQRESHRI